MALLQPAHTEALRYITDLMQASLYVQCAGYTIADSPHEERLKILGDDMQEIIKGVQAIIAACLVIFSNVGIW